MAEETKKEGFFGRIKKKASSALETTREYAMITFEVCKENKEVLAALIMAVVSVGTTGYKVHAKKEELETRMSDKLTDVYDPNIKVHTHINRPMRRDEEKRFNEMAVSAKEDKTSYYEILEAIDKDNKKKDKLL
jgi:hypothetical protein